MTPFKIECGDCGASLKISDPSHIGKLTKCPKCRGLVKVTPPDDEAFLSSLDSNEYEDLPYEPDPEPAPKKPKKKPTKRPTRHSSDNSIAKKVGIGVCVLIGLVLGFLSTNPNFNLGDAFAWLGGGPSGIAPDLTWLPDGLDSVGEVRVSQLVQTPAVTEALKKPEAIAGVAMMTGILGFNLHDVDSVRFGLLATPTRDSGRFSAVVKLIKPGRVATVLEAASGTTPPGATKTPHGSRLLYGLSALPTMSVCCIDDQTILFGTTNELKSVLDKEGKPESTSRFSIVDKPHQLVMIVAPSKPESANGFLGDGNMELFRTTPTTALSFSADLDSMVHAVLNLRTKSSRNAQQARAEFEKGLKDFARSPLAITVPKELQQALASVKVTASGRTVTITGDVPTNALVSALSEGNAGLPGAGPPSLTPPAIEFNPSVLEIPPIADTPAPVQPDPSVTTPTLPPVVAPAVAPPASTRPPRAGDAPQTAPARRPSGF